MFSHKKRERTQNWTQEEKILLLQLCSNKINILENKKADQYSLTIKTHVWKEIHNEFIAKLGTDRNILRLKEQWQRMKKQARSELQDFKIRVKKQGEQIAQQRKISTISEEVLKIMDLANKHYTEDDGSYSSSESFDNIPTYFCETEVKQEDEDDITTAKILDGIVADNSYDTFPQMNLRMSNKRDTILNILASICQNQNNITDNLNVNKNKRKLDEVEDFQFFDTKREEHEKRMLIIEEQLKTAKLQRETAEIHKQLAQQELKQVLLQYNKLEKNSYETANEETRDKLRFHQNQIKFHEDQIANHKQQIENIKQEQIGRSISYS